MFNPLVDNLGDMSEDEINNKVQDLTKKYFQTQNFNTQNQIRILIDMYNQEKSERAVRRQQNSGDSDLDNLINID